MIIAIDGPAGAGKSTVARAVARELGLAFLDTGAMYRAVALVAIQRGVDPADAAACAGLAREVALSFDAEGRIEIDGEPGEPDIRGETVTSIVSAVSAHPAVREAVVRRQRELVRDAPPSPGAGAVVEGRDTTTVVFPDADHKFFLEASVRERARRRAVQSGREAELDAIQRDIERRDRLDTTRAHSPLVKAPDAVVIDTAGKDADAVAAAILAAVGTRPPR